MTTSSFETRRVLKGADAEGVRAMASRDLRGAQWTRFGTQAVHGDPVTEAYLEGIAEQTKAAAQAQGYAAGWAEGRRRAAEEAAVVAEANASAMAEQQRQITAEHIHAIQRWSEAAAQLESAVAEATRAVDESASTLVMELLEVLLGHSIGLESGMDVVRRALAATPPADLAIIRMHARQVADVMHLEEGPAGETVRIEADPTLKPGEAVVVVNDQLVDLRIRKSLERIREALK